MKSVSFGERVKHVLVEPRYPGVGIELNSDCIRLAVIRADHGKLGVLHLDSEPLPAGALEVTPFKPNILSMEAVAAAMNSLWRRNPHKSAKVSLLIQDRSALVFNLVMEHPARNPAECMELIRFKLKKSVPFRMEDAQVTYFAPRGTPDHSSAHLWVIVVNHALLNQCEQFVQSALNVEVGLVDLTTLGLMNLAHPAIRARGLLDRDILYVNLSHDYLSLAISQKSNLTSFRTRPLDSVASRIDAAMDEVHPTVMYYQDKLAGEGFAFAFVHAPDNVEELCAAIESRTGIAPLAFPMDSYTSARFDPSHDAALRGFAPLAGLLLSRTVEFA
jgi:type IV pilus assembly protein PilM